MRSHFVIKGISHKDLCFGYKFCRFIHFRYLKGFQEQSTALKVIAFTSFKLILRYVE